VRIDLRPIAYRLPTGHRVRLAISCADFPAVWPTPVNPTVRAHHGPGHPSRVVLPVVRATASPAPPRIAPSPELTPWDAGGAPGWKIERDLVQDSVAVTLAGRGSLNLPNGVTFELEHTARATVSRAHPEQARLDAGARIQISAPGLETVIVQARGRHARRSMLYEGTVTVDGHVAFTDSWQTGDGDAGSQLGPGA
jgi:hypothetical protein